MDDPQRGVTIASIRSNIDDFWLNGRECRKNTTLPYTTPYTTEAAALEQEEQEALTRAYERLSRPET